MASKPLFLCQVFVNMFPRSTKNGGPTSVASDQYSFLTDPHLEIHALSSIRPHVIIRCGPHAKGLPTSGQFQIHQSTGLTLYHRSASYNLAVL